VPVIQRMLAAAFLFSSAVASACSGGASFAEPGPCPPLPNATSTPVGRPPGGNVAGGYIGTIRGGLQRISDLRQGQRSLNPDDTFSRKPEFRTAFVTYADNTVCAAEALKALNPPNQNYTGFDKNLEAALQALIDHTVAGREAVRKRNTSDYRAWYKDVDVKIEAVNVVFDGRPR
jgi:hypothetical protein